MTGDNLYYSKLATACPSTVFFWLFFHIGVFKAEAITILLQLINSWNANDLAGEGYFVRVASVHS
jgi:hypothetical protein